MKPPILSDEQTRRTIGRDRKLKTPDDFRKVFEDVCLAQRDADAAYYEPLIEQAKAEVAEKVFQDIEEELAAFEGFSVKTQHQAAIVRTNWWQFLKSKYTGGKLSEVPFEVAEDIGERPEQIPIEEEES